VTASLVLLLASFVGYLAAGFGIFHGIYQGSQQAFPRWRKVLWSAFALHTVALLIYCLETGQLPILSLKETFAPLAWTVMLMYLVVGERWGVGVTGAVAAPAASAMTLFSAFAIWQGQGTTDEGPGLVLHILSMVIGFASLFLASFCVLLHLVQSKLLKEKRLDGIYRALPPLGTLDKVVYRLIWAGFPALLIGILSGIFNSGGHWTWRIQEIVVVATSIVYTIYLHARVAGYQGKRLNAMLLLASLFAAISFLLPSGHQ
jgi:ABC-type transport system involved in cytochrome c biogenesis permease subunit